MMLSVRNAFPVVGPTMHEVVRPDMVAMLRPQPDARPVIQPEPPLLWLFHWHFQPLSSPQPFDALVVHMPASISQQRSDPTIAVAAILPGQFDHVGNQSLFISTTNWHLTLCGSVLSQNATRSAF
jgi:hypothetical protein